MGFLHTPELVLLVIAALVIFGPKKLPEIGSSLGKGIREFRKSTEGHEDTTTVTKAVQIPPVAVNDVVVPEKPVEVASVPREPEIR